MYSYEIKTILNKLSSYRKSIFSKYKNISEKDSKKININEYKKLLEDMNKVSYSEEFILKIKNIYEKKKL
jgi:hypothetical protein